MMNQEDNRLATDVSVYPLTYRPICLILSCLHKKLRAKQIGRYIAVCRPRGAAQVRDGDLVPARLGMAAASIQDYSKESPTFSNCFIIADRQRSCWGPKSGWGKSGTRSVRKLTEPLERFTPFAGLWCDAPPWPSWAAAGPVFPQR